MKNAFYLPGIQTPNARIHPEISLPGIQEKGTFNNTRGTGHSISHIYKYATNLYA